MSIDVIQADYDKLGSIAGQFAKNAESTVDVRSRIENGVQALQNGKWEGQAATAFFTEMNRDISPVMTRLTDALEQAQSVTLQVKDILQAAEEEAARPFGGEGQSSSHSKKPSHLDKPAQFGQSGDFVIGTPKKPEIHHDDGFLGVYDAEKPTAQDYLQLAEWRVFLEGSKLATKAGIMDLDDANDAYEHFLDGNGVDRTFDLDEYYAEDPSGQKTVQTAIQDAQKAAEKLGQSRDDFQMSSDRAFSVGTNNKLHPDYGRFDYPQTENWQKAIGAHQMWTSADVQVSINPDGTRHYSMEITIHAEDKYNFNPGDADITTGITDAANGRFAITGLAKQYMNYGQTTRVVEWNEGQYSTNGAQSGTHDNRGQRIGPNTRDRPRPSPRAVRGNDDRTRPPLKEGTDKLRNKITR